MSRVFKTDIKNEVVYLIAKDHIENLKEDGKTLTMCVDVDFKHFSYVGFCGKKIYENEDSVDEATEAYVISQSILLTSGEIKYEEILFD